MTLQQFSDQANLEGLVEILEGAGFRLPKWVYRYNVPIRELASCSRRKFLCDVVAYREDRPVIVFELDGRHHVEEKQERLDAQKERILRRHGIRLWRMWNGELKNCEADHGRLLRRYAKAHMYAPHGALACDWRKLCDCLEGGQEDGNLQGSH